MAGTEIRNHPIHLGLGASAAMEPEFDASLDWCAACAARHAGDGAGGWLVSLHTFPDPREAWEMHPAGCEVVLCTAGSITLHQEGADGSTTSIILEPGHYAIGLPGTWHTADVTAEATALFITAGLGTQHRPR